MSAQREAFEAWAGPRGFTLSRFEHAPDEYIIASTRDAWRSWQAAQAAMPQRVPMTEAQKIDIMDTTHVMTTRMERAIARWFKAQPLRETQAETPVEPRVEDLAMQARAAALEEAALLVESRCDQPAEAAVDARVKAAVEDGDEGAELRARRHWLDVSTHNAVLRRAAAGIRALAATARTGGAA